MKSIKLLLKWPAFMIAALSFAIAPVSGQAGDDPQSIVDGAVATLTDFASGPNKVWFKKHIMDAKGVLIVPSLVKAGGSGVMLARVSDTRKWSHPVFYSMVSETLGQQTGAEKAGVVVLVMTDKGMNAMLSNKFQIGVEVSVAAGAVAARSASADILQFSRGKELTLKGAVITVRDKWNQDYYGQDVLPADILIRHTAQAAGASRLRSLLADTAR